MNCRVQVRLAEYMLTMVEPDIGEEVERGGAAFSHDTVPLRSYELMRAGEAG